MPGVPDILEGRAALKIEHQPFGFASRTANNDLVVFLLLFCTENRVPVIRNPRNDALRTRSTNSDFAGTIDVKSLIQQHLKNRFACRNKELSFGARQAHLESASDRSVLLGQK